MRNIQKIGSRRLRSQALVEFAFVFPLFLFTLFGLIDYANYLFQNQTVAHAVREGGRIATTGRILFTNEYEFTDPSKWVTNSTGFVVADPAVPTRQMSREQAILYVMMKSAAGMTDIQTDFGNKVTNSASTGLYFSIESWPGTNSATESSPNKGPGQRTDDEMINYVRISVNYPATVLTPVSAFSGLLGNNSLFSSNKLMITYKCTFVNEAWSYNNTNQW
jgi:TadE-like protein